jgi:hypothetical protein
VISDKGQSDGCHGVETVDELRIADGRCVRRSDGGRFWCMHFLLTNIIQDLAKQFKAPSFGDPFRAFAHSNKPIFVSIDVHIKWKEMWLAFSYTCVLCYA